MKCGDRPRRQRRLRMASRRAARKLREIYAPVGSATSSDYDYHVLSTSLRPGRDAFFLAYTQGFRWALGSTSTCPADCVLKHSQLEARE